jgi:hypothetical protein
MKYLAVLAVLALTLVPLASATSSCGNTIVCTCKSGMTERYRTDQLEKFQLAQKNPTSCCYKRPVVKNVNWISQATFSQLYPRDSFSLTTPFRKSATAQPKSTIQKGIPIAAKIDIATVVFPPEVLRQLLGNAI